MDTINICQLPKRVIFKRKIDNFVNMDVKRCMNFEKYFISISLEIEKYISLQLF